VFNEQIAAVRQCSKYLKAFTHKIIIGNHYGALDVEIFNV